MCALALVLCGVRASAQQEVDRLFVSAVQAQQRGDLPAAIRDYQKLLQLNPKLTDARVNLGAALSQTGLFDEAIAQYKLALAAIPENADVRRNLGLAYYKKGNLPSAIREFETLRKQRPGDVSLAVLLGDSEVRSGKGPDALAMLTPMEAANATNQDFEYVMGTALIASGKRRDGVARLQKVAESTQNADAYFLAGSTLLDLNEGEAARKDLEAALKLNPNLPRIDALVGMARDRTGEPAEAAKAFREALRLDPGDFDANLYLGAILTKQRDLEQAKGYLDHALEVNPTSTMARYEVALWKSTSGKYADAVTDLERIVKEDPSWLEPHVELATVYYRLHRPEEGAAQRAIVAKLTEEQQKKGPGD